MTKCHKHKANKLILLRFMLGKIGILVTILALVFIFFLVISFGAGAFSNTKINHETKKYLKSVNILLAIIAIVGIILVLFL